MVVPISIPNIDWPTLQRLLPEALGRSPFRNLDAAKEPVGTLRAYIALLAAIDFENSDSRQAIKDSGASILDHLSFGFLIIDHDYILTILKNRYRSLAATSSRSGMILTGSLTQWKVALSEKPNGEVAHIFQAIFGYFEQLGLRDIWFGYRKTIKDSVFMLEQL